MSNDKIKLSIKIKPKDQELKQVSFEFNVKEDTPDSVADEMVKTFKLPSNYADIISSQMKELIHKKLPKK